MKNKTLFFLSSLFIIFIAVFFFGCKEEVDHDLIQGKWVKECIILDSTATDCQKKAYIEFSNYILEGDYRIVSQRHACEEEGEIETETGTDTFTIPPYSEQIGYYTVSGDTLRIKSMNNITNIYTIGYINAEKMKLSSYDKDGILRDTIYRRFN